jgi:hypothetical protein
MYLDRKRIQTQPEVSELSDHGRAGPGEGFLILPPHDGVALDSIRDNLSCLNGCAPFWALLPIEKWSAGSAGSFAEPMNGPTSQFRFRRTPSPQRVDRGHALGAI